MALFLTSFLFYDILNKRGENICKYQENVMNVKKVFVKQN